MKIEGKHRLEIRKADVSGSVFDDADFHNINLSGSSFDNVNMSGWRIHNANLAGLRIDEANLAGASIVNGRLEGMTIDGHDVNDLIAFWREGHRAAGE
jgi:uncharacterized protein YjbI with pentapeptide repeats